MEDAAFHTFHNPGCSMLGIAFATVEEAAPFVEQYANGRPEELEEGRHLRTGDVLVTVSGEGKIKATLNTERLLREYDLDVLLHVGGCTALTDELQRGALVGATFVLEGDRVDLDTPTYPRMPLQCPFEDVVEGTLVTQDHPRDDADEQSYWERLADVRDTTGYAVAYVAAQHGTPCHVVKVVTREADDSDDEDARAMYEALASFLQNYLQSQSSPADS